MSFTSPVLDHPNYPVTDVSYWMQGCLGPYAQLDSTDIVVGTCHATVLACLVWSVFTTCGLSLEHCACT
jgi:hypothetical protein